MALIQEDGSMVEGANSFASVAQLRQFASDRGTTLPVPDAEVCALAIRAIDYLQSLEESFQGTRVSASQPLPFPRSGVTLYGAAVASNIVPLPVVQAQCAIVLALTKVDLMPIQTGKGFKTREKVGELESEYLPQGASPASPLVVSLLAPLRKSTSTLKVLRA